MIPPPRTAVEVFLKRRQRMQGLLARNGIGCALVVSGLPQPRNFAHNFYPFRPSSHFLYLLGRPLEAALLSIGPDRAVLYMEPPDPVASLWTGPQPTLDELADQLQLSVLPLDDFQPPERAACLPPVDALTTLWLSDLIGRELEPAHGEPDTTEDGLLMDVMIELRLRHDRAALSQIRAALRATETAHWAGMQATRSASHEFEVRGAMEGAIRRAGMGLAYGPIVTTHGEVLHHESSDRPIGPGELILADVGAETPEGWAADVTRTWPSTGRFSPTQRELYEVVLRAQHSALGRVGPGVRYRDVHWAALVELARGLVELGVLSGRAEDLVEQGAPSVFCPHGVGHLLGLDVHDMEDLGDRAGYAKGRQRSLDAVFRFLRLDRDLEPGMVVTIEPGFYQVSALLQAASRDAKLSRMIDFEVLARYGDVRGIRIEDDVLVTESGSEVLSERIPKRVEDVEAACAP